MRALLRRVRNNFCTVMRCPMTVQAPIQSVPTGSRMAAIRYFDGLQVAVHPGDCIGEHIAATGFWEAELSEKIIEIGKEGGLLVDVGANIGYFSLLWARANPNNRVYAFEASPRNFPKLVESVGGNGFSDRISYFCVALSSAIEIHEFVLGPEEQTGWGGLMKSPNEPSTKVICMRLDQLLTDETIRVLKIDVEGADTLVLRGCERLLRERRRIEEIFYEQNKPRLKAIGLHEGEAQSYLAGLGYEVINITPLDHEVVEWYARLPLK